MPRNSNSNRSFSTPKVPVSIPSAPTYKPPVSLPSAPVVVQKERPGFFSNMWQGFGLGAGQSIAHNMFRSDPIVKHEYIHTTQPKEYEQCMKDNNNDKDLCEQFLTKN